MEATQKSSESIDRESLVDRPSGQENAQKSAPPPDTVSPALLASSLDSVAQSICRDSPGALDRMTAGDFIATVMAVLRSLGEVPRRLRTPPVPAVHTMQQTTFADVVRRRRPSSATPKPSRQPSRQAIAQAKKRPSRKESQESNDTRVLRRKVLSACVNSFKRTKDQERRVVYNQFVKSVANLKDFISKMTPQQLKSLPKDRSYLLGIGIIPEEEIQRDWYVESTVAEAKELQLRRKAGSERKISVGEAKATEPVAGTSSGDRGDEESSQWTKVVGRKSPPPPKPHIEMVRSSTGPVGGVKKTPPTDSLSAYKGAPKKVPPKGSKVPERAHKTRAPVTNPDLGKKTRKEESVNRPELLKCTLEKPVSFQVNGLKAVNGIQFDDEGRPSLPVSSVGKLMTDCVKDSSVLGPVTEAFRKWIAGDILRSQKESPNSLSPDDVVVTFACKAPTDVMTIITRPQLRLKTDAPRIKFSAVLFASHPKVTDVNSVRVLLSPVSDILSGRKRMANAGWIALTARPTSSGDGAAQEVFEKDPLQGISFSPCVE